MPRSLFRRLRLFSLAGAEEVTEGAVGMEVVDTEVAATLAAAAVISEVGGTSVEVELTWAVVTSVGAIWAALTLVVGIWAGTRVATTADRIWVAWVARRCTQALRITCGWAARISVGCIISRVPIWA